MNLDSYEEFRKRKRVIFRSTGIEVDKSEVNSILFPFQRDLVVWSLRKGRSAIFADTGLGKAQPIDELVLTPQGWRPIGGLSIGDTIIGGDGYPTLVTGVYPQGPRLIADIEFNDGAKTRCDFEHLWTVTTDQRASRGEPWYIKTTQEIADSLHQPSDERLRWRVPTVSVQLPGRVLPIDPYVLGVLLGDGCLTGSMHVPTFTTTDQEIVGHINNRLPHPFTARPSTYSDRAPSYRITRLKGKGAGSSTSMILEALRNLGLWGSRAATKFIPPIYLLATEAQRLDLLRGLMDSDGWTGTVTQFTSTSKQLALDVQNLARSLGAVARLTSKIPTFRDKEGNRRNGKRAYNVTIKLPIDTNPFLLSRKAKKYREIKRLPPVRKIKSIWPLEYKEVVCIQVAALHQTYVTRDYVVTHNTLMQLEWARLLDTPTLIVAPLSVAKQTIREGQEKLDLEVEYVRAQPNKVDGLHITNYEMVGKFDPSRFGAVVLDESSILKGLGGKTRQKVTEMFANTPYRLCCTATPAPNDISEIANHAEFLGVMTRNDMLSTFFVNDDEGYRLRGHASDKFYRWMASWGMSVKKPSDLGYSDDGFILPPLNVKLELVKSGYIRPGELFFTGIRGIQDRSKIRQATLTHRIDRVAELVNSNGDQWIVWCGLNKESQEATRAIDGAVEVSGADSLDSKIDKFEGFISGKYRVLVTKPKIGGFGLNLQHAHKMAFVGLSDSWESYYQCVAREHRYMQKEPVDVHIVLADVEEPIFQNVKRKEEQAEQMSKQLIKHVAQYEREELDQEESESYYQADQVITDDYTVMLGDSVERLKELDNESVDLSIFSPPFLDLFTYSPTERDLGNSLTEQDFFEHFNYIIDELLRVTKPGRICAVHTADVPALLSKDGYIGLKDFPGKCIVAFENRGWIYHGRVAIDKNPQAQAIRTHAKALLFNQIRKDSSWSRPAIGDYILSFMKPGENLVPINPVENKELTNEEWILWAHPIWYSIQESNTLQYRHARSETDDKHVCPLQLETIRRCVTLWSNPGETVLDPFAGIGSTLYIALKMKRKAIGIELKPLYYDVMLDYARKATKEHYALDLFDMAEQFDRSMRQCEET